MKKSKKKLIRVKLRERSIPVNIVAKNFAYVSLNNGKLLKVNIEDGKMREIYKIDSDKISRPYVIDKNMYILRNDAIVKIK